MRPAQHRRRLHRLQQEAERHRWRKETAAADDRIPITLLQLAGLKPTTEADWQRLESWLERHPLSSEEAAAL